MRIRFVVLEQDVETRFVLLDQVRFENESLDLVIDDDELKIRDQFDELPGFRVEIPARLKILADAAPQVFGLSNVDYSAGRVLVYINAGIRRQYLEFFVDRHSLNSTAPANEKVKRLLVSIKDEQAFFSRRSCP